MPTPTRVPLGAATTVRKWQVDVNTGTHAAPTWVGVFGVTDFKPAFEAHLEDDSDFDSGGYMSQTKTAEAWSAELKVARKVTASDPSIYDPGQEYIRGKAIGKMGPANSVEIRFYEMTPAGPRVEAYQGYAVADWSPEGGKMTALDGVAMKLVGQGKLDAITHPDTGANIPVVSAISPTGGSTAGGTLAVISGGSFTGATAVKFGAVNAPSFTVLSDGRIAVITPAGTGGAKDVLITNPAGTNAAAGVSFTYA